jgi:hypothetical protein
VSADDRIDRLYSTQGQDVFAYGGNNPVYYIDPDGHYIAMYAIKEMQKKNTGIDWIQKSGDAKSNAKGIVTGVATQALTTAKYVPGIQYNPLAQDVIEGLMQGIDNALKPEPGVDPKADHAYEVGKFGGTVLFNEAFFLASYGASTGSSIGKGSTVLRQQYLQEVDSIGQQAQAMLSNGMSAEQIVRTLAPVRNTLKLNIRAQGSWLLGKIADARNYFKYGDKAGPSPEWLLKRYKTWEDALEALTRTNSTVNKITGVGR